MPRGSEAASSEPSTGVRRPIGRVVLALVVAVGGVIAVAVLAGSVGRSRSGEGAGLSTAPPGEALDAVVMALLTIGLALTIAMFVVQFGGEREDRQRTARRRLIGVLLVPVLLLGMTWLVQEAGIELNLDVVPEGTEGEGGGGGTSDSSIPLPDATERDTSNVGSWTGIVFGLLLLAVGSIWMWGERRRRTLELSDAEAGDDRDQLASLLSVAIDDLRNDPDPRRAVIRAWNDLGSALASVGLPRDDAEAPFPYLERALDVLDTSGPAAARLTTSFETALFSSRDVDRTMQLDAVDALVAVRDELQVGSAVTGLVVGVGVIVLLVLLGLLARANPGSTDASPGLVARRDAVSTTPRIPELLAWEADLLAASTGGRRGRTRLGRKLAAVIGPILRDRHGVQIDDPEALELLGPEWEFLCGGAPPSTNPRISVDEAVTVVLDRLVATHRQGRA